MYNHNICPLKKKNNLKVINMNKNAAAEYVRPVTASHRICTCASSESKDAHIG